MTPYSMGAEVVPFGKYKGEPVEVLLADTDYCEWLRAQPWLSEKQPTIYQLIINYGGPAQDTPEHNQMQALFLDDAHCLRLATAIGFDIGRRPTDKLYVEDGRAQRRFEVFGDRLESRYIPAQIRDRVFEHSGWDVAFEVIGETFQQRVTSLPECTCGSCDHEDCHENSTCRGTRQNGYTHFCDHYYCDRRNIPSLKFVSNDSPVGHHPDCVWSNERMKLLVEREWDWYWGQTDIYVELKPDLGDDFPTVLRQVKGYPCNGWRRCVVVRRHQFQHVTWEQVAAIFKTSRIRLIHESDLIEGDPF